MAIYCTPFVRGRHRGTSLRDAKAVLLRSPSEVEGLLKRLRATELGGLRTGFQCVV